MPRQPVLMSIVVAVAASVAACGADEPSAEPAAAQESAAAEPVETSEPTESDEAPEESDDAPEEEWVSVTDEPSGARFLLPEASEPFSNTAIMENGAEVALRNYSATTDDGIQLGFNIIETSGGSYDLDAGVAGVEDTLDGEVVSAVDTEVAGQDAVDVEMTYGDDMFVLFTLISTEDYVMQTLASGPEDERSAVEATFEHLNSSLEVR